MLPSGRIKRLCGVCFQFTLIETFIEVIVYQERDYVECVRWRN